MSSLVQLLAAATPRDRFLDGFRYPFLALVIAATVAWFLTPLVRKVAIDRGVIDDPKADDRRVHTEPIPRWGGIAIYAGILASLAAVLPFAYPHKPFPVYLVGILVCGAVIVVMGALDDLYKYSAKVQLLYIIGLAVAVQFFIGPAGQVQIHGFQPFWGKDLPWVDFAWATVPLTAIYIFLITKTMDTIDGIDGLAAGIAAISSSTLAIIAVFSEQPRVALVCAATGGAALGFLRHNYNPARIFMGTGGAQLLGFMLASLTIVGAIKTAAAVALIIPVLVFGVPVFDAAFVVFRRILHRQPITQADKRHLHHTLMSRGLNQRQTVWILYSLAMLLCAILLVTVRTLG
ncbi:MAG: undecaprenyl/decaprenyl-phosphate alpha-N-acetylglucosaminyl 1-phosphate transferase [Chthonomonas sp.]|nr:undecaprenyl/decaprenyl-phosphate alpha-N-acetylglucosaminyl 1-phosphate transferase [Chthonomonas sp.]